VPDRTVNHEDCFTMCFSAHAQFGTLSFHAQNLIIFWWPNSNLCWPLFWVFKKILVPPRGSWNSMPIFGTAVLTYTINFIIHIVHFYLLETAHASFSLITFLPNLLGGVWAVPRLCKFYPGIWLTTEEKARKNLSQGSRRVLVYILPKRTRYKTYHKN